MPQKPTRDQKKRNPRNFPFYPILFGIFPVLALTAYNISQIDLSAAYRSFLITLILTLGLFGILRIIMRDWSRAALLSLFLLILFLSYGHVYTLLKDVKVFGVLIARHRSLAVVWVALTLLVIWFSTRKSIDFSFATQALNIVSVLLVVYSVFQIARYEGEHYLIKPVLSETNLPTKTASPSSSSPDIYYIILDAYGRTDTFQQVYNFDNSSFLNSLKDRGFYIANCSQTNYGYTELSLASSLNLDYLDNLNSGLSDPEDLIQQNYVRRFLKSQGYRIVSFETGFRWSQWEDADVYLSLQKTLSVINPFESVYLETTPVRILMDYETGKYMTQAASLGTINTVLDFDALHYAQIMHNLDLMKTIPASIKGPKFVFAHFVIPHPPYIYSSTGALVPDATNYSQVIAGYRNAVIFIDTEMLEVVDKIIANSTTPPIIVIQGDHGPFTYNTPLQHMSILNVYYLPGAKNSLYSSISPVNTFRVIFNSYFGMQFPLLKDVSRYSPSNNRENFTIIPNACGTN